MAAARSADPATLPAVLSRQRIHLHPSADARAAATTAVETLLITAAVSYRCSELRTSLAASGAAPVSGVVSRYLIS